MRRTVLILFGIVALLGVFPAAGRGPDANRWAVEGVMSDACQCQLFCPCEFLSKPTPMVFKNGPFEEAGFGEVLVAQSDVYKYRNPELGIDWDYGGRSASIRTFKLEGAIAPE